VAWANVFKRTKSLMNHPSHVICVYLWELRIGTAGNMEEEEEKKNLGNLKMVQNLQKY
jgi:hypothetical protein